MAKKILVVDDEQVVRRIASNHLTQAGYQVATAADGVEAMEKLRCQSFDLMLLDLNMPRMNGLEVLTNMAADPQYADLPIVVLTETDPGVTDISVWTQRPLTCGLQKPFNIADLLALVATTLEPTTPEAG
ncbi:MAG: response regulator [Candidatus Berkelbacteria bacterium]